MCKVSVKSYTCKMVTCVYYGKKCASSSLQCYITTSMFCQHPCQQNVIGPMHKLLSKVCLGKAHESYDQQAVLIILALAEALAIS